MVSTLDLLRVINSAVRDDVSSFLLRHVWCRVSAVIQATEENSEAYQVNLESSPLALHLDPCGVVIELQKRVRECDHRLVYDHPHQQIERWLLGRSVLGWS